jgi:predicted Rossmann-fold nucleotide-binding protein
LQVVRVTNTFMGNYMKRICVNYGSNPGFRPEYLDTAKRIGTVIGRTGLELVYGGPNVGLMNVSGYFNPFLTFLDHAVCEGFIRKEHRDILFVSEEPQDLLKGFDAFVVPAVEKWIEI